MRLFEKAKGSMKVELWKAQMIETMQGELKQSLGRVDCDLLPMDKDGGM